MVARSSLSGGIGASSILSPSGKKVSLYTVTYGLGNSGISPNPYFQCQKGVRTRRAAYCMNLKYSSSRRRNSHNIAIN